MKIEFSKYISDGPGYVGAVCVDLDPTSATLELIRGGAATSKTLPLNPVVPRLLTVAVSTREVIEKLWLLLEESDRDYFSGTPSDIDAGRVRLLGFEDGRFGALMLMGEPQYACLAIFGDGVGAGSIQWLNFE